MLDPQNDELNSGPSTDIQRPAQYPSATKIENGVAYDISGKALGPVADTEQQAAPAVQKPKFDPTQPIQAAGSQAVQKPKFDPTQPIDTDDSKDKQAAAMLDEARRNGIRPEGLEALKKTLVARGAKLPDEPGPLRKMWDWMNEGLIDKATMVRAISGMTPEQLNENLQSYGTETPGHAAFREFTRGVIQDTGAVGSSFTSPLAVGTIGVGEIAGAAGASSRAANALRIAKNAETAVDAADAALAARTTEVARAAQQANDARLAAEAAEAAEKAGTSTKAATIAAQNTASEAAANALKAQEALKTAELTRATNAVESAKAARLAEKAAEAAKKAGTLGQLPERARTIAAPIAKTAAVGFTGAAAKEALTGRQEGETREEEIERRLQGLGFALLGAEGLKGGALDIPMGEIPGKIGEAYEKWHQERAAKRADNSVEAIAGRKEFMKAIPPSKAAPYDDNDLAVGDNYIEHHHANVESIDGIHGMRDALEHECQGIEDTVSGLVQKYAREPIIAEHGGPANVRADVRAELAKNADKTFVNKGLKELENYDLTDPSMEEADSIRRSLNAKTRGTMKDNRWDVATALESDPVFAAQYYAAESLRNGEYNQLEAKGVKGAREMRQDESSLIRLRNASERQIYASERQVRGTSDAGPVRKLAAKGATVAGAGIGAGIGEVTGIPGAPEVGAIAGGYVGKKVGEAIAPPDLTRDALIQRRMKRKIATGVPTQLEGVGEPSNPPVEPTPKAPFSEHMEPELQKLYGEYTPLHSDLATHYGETLGDSNYSDLEERFLSDVAIKKEHKVPLDPAEKKLLADVNKAKVEDVLRQRGVAEEQRKSQEAAAKEAAKARKEKEEAGLITNIAPPFAVDEELPVPERLGKINSGGPQLRTHELGHLIMVDEFGHAPHDIISHNHPQIGKSALAEARWDKSQFITDEGKFDLTKLPDMLAILYGGPVAEEVLHGMPVDTNPGAGADITRAYHLLVKNGFSPTETGMMLKAAEMKAREVLTSPGVKDIVQRYTGQREAGLKDELHMSPLTIGKAIQEVRFARGNNGKPTNEGPVSGRTGKAGKQVNAGGEGPTARSTAQGTRAAGKEGTSPRSSEGTGQEGAEASVAEAANEFNRSAGRPEISAEKVPHVPATAERIAQAYEAMPHAPNEPAVKKAYDAAKKDIDAQWDYATDKMGVKFEPWTKEGQPYANSKEMTADVKNNKHLYFFQGGELPADHPLAATDSETGLSYNDKLRAVHDLFGHAAHEFQFGPKGEENAWNVHRQMFSPEAIPAITTETRGQNSWVNYGQHLRVPFQEGRTVPPERTAGENDAAIKQGGGVPGGIQKGDPEIDIPDLVLFHDPTTGSTLALKAGDVTPEAVREHIQQSRAQYLAKKPEQSRIPEKGQPGYIAPTERPYAQNKAGILPAEFHTPNAPEAPEAGLKTNVAAQPHGQEILDAMRKGIGETTDPASVRDGASFITPEGTFIKLGAGTHHPDAIDAYGGKGAYAEGKGGDVRPAFLEESGAIRVRHSFGKAGETLQVSVPPQGVTEGQLKALRQAVGKVGREGNLYIERADATPENPLYARKEFPRVLDVDDMLKQIKAYPDKNAPPNDSILGHRAEDETRGLTTNIAPPVEWHAKAADRAAKEPAGGIDPYTGQSATEGIGTEIVPEARKPLPRVPHAEDFRSYRDQHEHLFQTHPDLKVGWDNNSNVEGGHELNIGAVGPNAAEVARKLGQRSAWDIGQQKEIPTGGTGEQTNFPGYTIEQRLADLNRPSPKGSSVELQKNPLPLKPSTETGIPSTTDVAMALSKYTKKEIGPLVLGKAEPAEQVARAKSLAEDEARYQLAQNNTGAAWYTTDMAKHDEILQGMRPELKDPAKLSMFKMVEAILSSGQKPYANFKSAVKAWDFYHENDNFPETNPDTEMSWGPRGVKAYGNALSIVNRLIEEKGEQGASDWLLADHTVKGLREYNNAKRGGGGGGVAGKLDDVLPGTMVLGPKRGPFAQNLHGKESAFTADMWVARSWHRWMGTAEIAPDGELATDRPMNAKERELMKQSFKETADKMGMTTSSLQAVLWYYEQALYSAHGSPKESWSFSDAAKRVADEEASSFKFGANAPATKSGLDTLAGKR